MGQCVNRILYRCKRKTSTELTHWGRVTHICVGKLLIIASGNGLSPGRRQAIIWTNAGILLIGPLGTKFNEFSIEIHTFSFKKMHLKMSSAKWRPFCLGLNVLNGMRLPSSWSSLNPAALDIYYIYLRRCSRQLVAKKPHFTVHGAVVM